MKIAKFGFLAIMLAGVMACSNGSDSSSISSNNPSFAGGVTALNVAEKVTVVDAKSSEISSSSQDPARQETAIKEELAPYDIPGGTPYYTDSTKIWVSERSAEVFNSVNNVLCLVSKLDYQAMLNQGDYVAQLDMSKCENQTDASGRLSDSQESSSSENAHPVYTRWVINSSRADGSSPHIVKSWVVMGDEKGVPQGIIYVLMTITEAKSDTNPLGIFRLDYGGHPFLVNTTTVDPSTWIMKGFLETKRDEVTGDVLLYYSSDEQKGGGGTQISKAVLNRDDDAGTGQGSVYSYTDDPYVSNPEANYDFYYNDTHFLRGVYNAATAPVYDDKSCYSRYFFDEVVHQYGLYNSTGQHVQHDSGMSLLYNDGANDYYGWIGYYGLWFPDQVNLTSGDTVYSVKYDPVTGNVIQTPYEAFISGGKLIKYTRGTVQLSDIRNVPLNWSEEYPVGSGTFVNYLAIWNGSSQEFEKTATVNYDTGTTQPIAYTPIDLTGFYNITFWSDSLGGTLRVDLMDVSGGTLTPDNSTVAIIYNQETVYPGAEDPDIAAKGFVCFENCPNGTPGIVNGTDPMYADSINGTLSQQVKVLPSSGLVNAITYDFDASRMQLIDNSSGYDVVLNEPGLWTEWGGIQSGPMIINAPANIDQLACWSGSSDLCSWKLWDNSPVFYIWTTSTNSWDRLSALKDSIGDFVQFEPPIKVAYVHDDPNSKYFGSKFFLEYYGFGDLQGIPGECTDKETGEPVSCGSNSWWTPAFSIPTGTELKDVETSESYLAKALEKEQKMKKTSTSLPCDTFTLTHYTLPDITEWLEPAIGTMPEVTAPPKVIDGQLQ